MANSQLLEIYSALRHNRDVFLLNQPEAIGAAETIHQTFSRLGLIPSQYRDNHQRSHVGLIPLVLLMQRQATAAFWSLASHQSYQAWVALRPCIESSLIIGKWLDDPANAKIWNERETNRKAYRKAYEGQALVSQSLPRSAEIRGVLTVINDDFMHLNTRYYHRHMETAPGGPDKINLLVHYFDRDDNEHRAHVMAFLHLMVFIQDSLVHAWRNLFAQAADFDAGLSIFEHEFRLRVDRLLTSAPYVRPVLVDLGLWMLD